MCDSKELKRIEIVQLNIVEPQAKKKNVDQKKYIRQMQIQSLSQQEVKHLLSLTVDLWCKLWRWQRSPLILFYFSDKYNFALEKNVNESNVGKMCIEFEWVPKLQE